MLLACGGEPMIALNLTDIKKITSHIFLKDTFDNFSFIDGEIVTFNTFRIDGYIQKDFFEVPEEPLNEQTQEFLSSLQQQLKNMRQELTEAIEKV